ncbi:hypothetical protein B0J17DRAFT_722550 [Rhizoctonia solani]|nr:hypothetical protein B0J17DRAFT_722550 [Rhizoctonia solani]
MGRSADKVPRYGGHLASASRSRGSTPNVSAGSIPLIPTEEGTQSVPYEGHPSHSEISERTLDLVSTAFPPSPLLSALAGVASSPRHGPTLDVASPPTPQHLELALPPLSPVSNNPGRVLPTGSAHESAPNPRKRADPTIQARPKLPEVKAFILCTGEPEIPATQDISLSKRGLARVRKLSPDHVIAHTEELIDVGFEKFFDPADIRKGGLLILIISCHGRCEYGDGVALQFHTQDGRFINSRMLQEKIRALPKQCTIEVIVDTCHAEGVIPGVRRILAMEPPTSSSILPEVPSCATACVPLSDSRFNTGAPVSSTSSGAGPSTSLAGLLKDTTVSNEQRQARYEAQVHKKRVFLTGGRPTWKAKEILDHDWGLFLLLNIFKYSFTIPSQAIFNHFSSHGSNTTRKDVWESIMEAVEQQNDARRERDLHKPLSTWASLIKENRIQRPILLTSVENTDQVLSGLMFQPIGKVRKTLPD